ncbi:MAG TPA: hypothetical protein PK490_14975 [Prosthecobacter sp.]|nr:hypothetical protein [Prosthecobacter sp.]
MKAFLFAALFCSSCILSAADAPPEVWPEIVSGGRKLLNAKVTKVKPEGLQILHDAGMETVPWRWLPDEVKRHYLTAETLELAQADAADEAERKARDAQAARLVTLEREAVKLSEINGLPVQDIRQAMLVRDWCLTHPQGTAEVSQADRDSLLAEARAVIEYRPETPPPAAVTTLPPPAAGGNSLSRGAAPRGLGGATPVPSGRSMKDHPERRLETAARRGNLHAAAALAGIPMAAGGVMESFLDGPFQGFQNGRVFRLTNGTLWEQQEMKSSLGGGLVNKVMILQTSEGTFMQLDGSGERVRVRQVR